MNPRHDSAPSLGAKARRSARVDPHAAGMYSRLDPLGEEHTRHAGRLFLIPVIGWPMVLGYRKALTAHFFRSQGSAMPEWKGRHAAHFWNGVRGIGVIQAYSAPAWCLLVAFAAASGYEPGMATLLGALSCLLAPILTNIALPCAVLATTLAVRGGPYIEPDVALAITALFHVAIFLVPAGFLRVSATGKFRSAFRFDRTLALIARRPWDYVRAWWFGLWMNLPILPLVPFAPQLLFWAYVASLVAFNQILIDEEPIEGVDRPRGGGWLALAYDLSDETERVLRTPFYSYPRLAQRRPSSARLASDSDKPFPTDGDGGARP